MQLAYPIPETVSRLRIYAMHKLNISRPVVDRVMARRGRLHSVEKIDPPRTSLLVIDMQNAYLAEGGPGYARFGNAIIPQTNQLCSAVRHAGCQVVWLRNTIDNEGSRAWKRYRDLRTEESWNEMAAALAKGSVGHEISPRMNVAPIDLVLDKYRYSAFIEGSSELHQTLRSRKIDTLVIAGVLTNVCCESTARDAMMLNYRVIMAAEATAAHTDEEYNSSLSSLLLAFGDVMSNAEIIDRLAERC
jgi:ureidoacrylate peracid hydrolase